MKRLPNDFIFQNDADHDVAIIVPTVATPDVLIPTMQLLAQRLDGYKATIVVAINSPSDENADACADAIDTIDLPWGCEFIVHRDDGPQGFGKAINHGFLRLAEETGIPPYVMIFNDDLRPTMGWLDRLIKCAESEDIYVSAESPPGIPMDRRTLRSRSDYGRIGMFGPVTDCAAGLQQVTSEGPKLRSTPGAYESFAARWGVDQKGYYHTANFLSGYCMMFTRECILDVLLSDDDGIEGPFDGDQFPIAGYEDNDICVRGWLKGWRCAIAGDAFIGHLGHQTFDEMFPEMQRGMRNRSRYYQKWQDYTQRDQTLAAVYRLRVGSVNDLQVFRQSIFRCAALFDGAAILLTCNPLELTEGNDWAQLAATLAPRDQQLLQECANAEPAQVADAFQAWCTEMVQHAANTQGGGDSNFPVVCSVWDGEFNERDERNAAIALAETLGTDWLISVDGDEIVEDRVTREIFGRLMKHPDPMIHSYDFGWLNHWDTPRLVRTDGLWGSGSDYSAGMNGPRMWRVCKDHPERIVCGTSNGLHCGNVPASSNFGRKVSGIRFRHYGYLRVQDREMKHARYRRLDPDADPLLVGNSDYNHILSEEGMTCRPFNAKNGIGFYMLCYAGEQADTIGMWFDQMFALADQMVLVWTDEIADSTVELLSTLETGTQVLDCEEWPDDAPRKEIVFYARVFGAEIVFHALDNNIAAARNAGMDALQKHPSLGWAVFFDPDEMVTPHHTQRALRNMAEVTDSWGFLVRFDNIHRGTSPSFSESIRMSRLVPAMRMDGRVHEGFHEVMRKLHQEQIHPKLRYAPFQATNLGLMVGDDELRTKLGRYRTMLLKDLHEDQNRPGSWVSLGMQFSNDGDYDKAQQCFERGVACAGTSFLPFRELALLHLRHAKAFLVESKKRLTRGHPHYDHAEKLLDVLEIAVPAQPILATNGDGRSLPECDVPHFDVEAVPEHLLIL